MNYTPGPWVVNYDPEEDDRPLEIVLADNPDHWVAFPASNGNPGDARLISAAPDLLEALKLAQSIIGHPDDAGSQIIAAAIAKATAP